MFFLPQVQRYFTINTQTAFSTSKKNILQIFQLLTVREKSLVLYNKSPEIFKIKPSVIKMINTLFTIFKISPPNHIFLNKLVLLFEKKPQMVDNKNKSSTSSLHNKSKNIVQKLKNVQNVFSLSKKKETQTKCPSFIIKAQNISQQRSLQIWQFSKLQHQQMVLSQPRLNLSAAPHGFFSFLHHKNQTCYHKTPKLINSPQAGKRLRSKNIPTVKRICSEVLTVCCSSLSPSLIF